MLKPILNSPGYFISNQGEVYNKNNLRLKTFFKPDGYERIRLKSLRHNKRVNFSIHSLVAEYFLNNGPYICPNTQINHINGNKKDNRLENLEVVSQTENVNHAHNLGLYNYDLPLTSLCMKTNKQKVFRSLREAAKHFQVSLNYLKPRIIFSKVYPFKQKYILTYDMKKYITQIVNLKGKKTIFVYDHVLQTENVAVAFSQLALQYGLPYITIGRKLRSKKVSDFYIGGYTISLKPLVKIIFKNATQASEDRKNLWFKLSKA